MAGDRGRYESLRKAIPSAAWLQYIAKRVPALFSQSFVDALQKRPMLARQWDNPGGPKLRPHSEGPPCPDDYAGQQGRPVTGDAFPPNCETASMAASKTVRWGARNLTVPAIAHAIYTFSNADKPVVEQTGLEGAFDFMVELTRLEFNGAGAAGPDAAPSPAGTAFVNAMREQFGLKLVATKAPVRIFVVDHVERPSEN